MYRHPTRCPRIRTLYLTVISPDSRKDTANRQEHYILKFNEVAIAKMATESKTMRTILETSEDWETWYDKLKTISANEFWNMADPDQPTVLPAAAPYKPVVADIVQGETLYTNLSAAN